MIPVLKFSALVGHLALLECSLALLPCEAAELSNAAIYEW